MRIYIIESKTYAIDSNGIEYQLADGGELPLVFTSKNRAIASAKRAVAIYQSQFGYKLVMESPLYPAVGDNCLYAARLTKYNDQWRQEFRVYKQLTWG